MNNNGAAVGRTTVKIGSGKKATTVRGPGFLWANGVSVVLPPLPGQPEAEATGTSDAGLVVGGPSIFMQATLGRATWWADTGAGYQPHDWKDLVDPSAGITLFGAVEISADGQYVGFRTGYGETYGGDVVAKVQLGANGLPVSIEDYWPVCDPWGLSAVVHDGGGLVMATGLGAPDVADPGTWLWIKNGDDIQKLDLHPPAESDTDGWDVNIHGEIAGTRRNSPIDRAAVWSADGTMLDIGTLGGAEAMALSINDFSQVVGWSLGGRGKNSGQRAFLWDGNGRWI